MNIRKGVQKCSCIGTARVTDAKGSAIVIYMCTCMYTQLRPANSIPMFIVSRGWVVISGLSLL